MTTKPFANVTGRSQRYVDTTRVILEEASRLAVDENLDQLIDALVPIAVQLPTAENRNGVSTAAVESVESTRHRTSPKPPKNMIHTVFITLSIWEGVVEAVSDETFFARLIDVGPETGDDAVPEYSEFSFDELAPGDRPLIEAGATFYWTLGRRINAAGGLTNESLVRFRRLPLISSTLKRQADAKAHALFDALG